MSYMNIATLMPYIDFDNQHIDALYVKLADEPKYGDCHKTTIINGLVSAGCTREIYSPTRYIYKVMDK